MESEPIMSAAGLRPQTESSFWRQLQRSSLSGRLMRMLPVAATVELILIVSVGYCLYETGQAAEREYSLLQASSGIAAVLRAGREFWESASRLRRDPVANEYIGFKRKEAALLENVDTISSALKAVQIKSDIVDDTKRSLSDFDKQGDEIFRRNAGTRREGFNYDEWQAESFKSLNKSVALIDEVHKLVHAGQQKSQNFEHYVFILTYLALIINVIFVVYGFQLIRSKITGPIVGLAKSCDRILEGKVIPEVASGVNDEISSLAEAFRKMSFVLAEDDKRKKNFQDLFRNVLSGSLQYVDGGLSRIMDAAGARQDITLNLLQMAQRCKRGLTHLSSILNSLSESVNSDSLTNVVVSPDEIDATVMVERALIGIESLLQERQINVVQNLARVAVHVDEQLMQRVMTNLLSNAIKFSPLRGQIAITIEEQGGSWLFVVRDQGPGIPPESRKKLFMRFGKMDNRDGKAREGTGLGLVICKEIVEGHGGLIGCESTLGAGSSFWFRLPKNGKAQPVAVTVSSASSLSQRENDDKKNARTRTASGRRQGITRYYVILLLVFIFSQSGIVLFLNGRFQQVQSEASLFHIRRERLIKTQELLSQLVKGKMQIVNAFESADTAKIAEAFNNFKEVFATTSGLETQNAALDQEGAQILNQMFVRERRLTKLMHSLPEGSQLSQFELALFYPTAKKAVNELEDSCARLMEIDQQSNRTSNVVGLNLRREIAFTLFADLVLTVLLFVLAMRHTVRLVQRANILAEKARNFVDGEVPEPSHGDNDEISWLDDRFCEVAVQLNSLEEKRQSLLAIVNHDLRTPINSMLLTLELLIESASQFNQQTAQQFPYRMLMEGLYSTKYALDGLFHRVNNFLLIERVQHAADTFKQEKLAVDEIVEGLIMDLSSRGVIDSNRLLSEMDDPDANWIVTGNRQLIEAMLSHLIVNACQYSSAPSPVTMKWFASKDNRMYIEVKSTGKIIGAELKAQLFDRYRVVGDTAIPGIGLPLAFQIARLYRGDLQLASNGFNECVFRVSLPMC
jgi:signal transduction histidine kinase